MSLLPPVATDLDFVKHYKSLFVLHAAVEIKYDLLAYYYLVADPRS